MGRGLRQVVPHCPSVWLLTGKYQNLRSAANRKAEVILVDKQLEKGEMCPDIRPVE